MPILASSSGGIQVIPLAGSLLFNGSDDTYLKIAPGVAASIRYIIS